jgi:putative membrane protein insertion efficiency factor
MLARGIIAAFLQRGARRALGWLRQCAVWLLTSLIRLYQRYFSILLVPACRFQPTCSRYALEALQRKKLHVALGLIIWRIARCQPLSKGGYDPVPKD